MKEIWKPISSLDGVYEASSLGRIRRGTKVLSPGSSRNGYLHVVPCLLGVARVARVHQLVAEAFLGDREDGQVVNHKNGVRDDNRIENLEYMTRSQNIKHGYDTLTRKRTSLRGTMVPQSKLDEAKVRAIKKRLSAGEQQTQIARDYGVSKSAINKIASGIWWRWVE